MKLVVSGAQTLFEVSESYFRSAQGRCVDHIGPCYFRSAAERCVIGNIVLTEGEHDALWLRSYRGNAAGLLAGFGVHPRTAFSELAVDLQILHDDPGSWFIRVFVAWDKLNQLKEKYKLK